MDPQSVAFQPRDDFWRIQSEMLRVQESQADLADRVARLERKQEDDSRLKNVWGASSPFPSVLGGTPQQGMMPLQQPTAEHFSNFDDQSSNLIGNLQLDADEEPRRIGATSRANSVRFDETANHGHWAHASRSSLDLIPRTGSGMGGHVMSERSYSHKSDGRQSSAGHSVHSMASGRANSLTSCGPTPPQDAPGLAPGLFILGSVPAIIRCWLNTNFKHDTLLYAAVCSGSYTSYLDLHLVEHLGFQDQVILSDDGLRKIKLSVYLPEAVPVSASSRSNSPAPQLPSVAVDFTIIEEHNAATNPKAIQILLGSDMLRAHNADLLFSCSQLTLYDDDHSKLQIPLVRPEDDRAFKSLHVSSLSRASTMERGSVPASTRVDSMSENPSKSVAHEQFPSADKSNGMETAPSSDDGGSSGRTSLEQRPHLALSASSRSDTRETQDPASASGAPRSGASPAIWSSWRRDQGEKTSTGSGSLDWASVGKTASSNPSYQRRDTGIKVLKPSKAVRTMSTSNPSPVTGQSRFFDDGKRRGETEAWSNPAPPPAKRSVSSEKGKENVPALSKPRSANPVGGASAFAWLNSGGNSSRASRQAISFKTASTNNKKRKIVAPAKESPDARDGTHSPNVCSAGVGSPRSSPQPSASPPRYLPPHLHDEVLVDASTSDSASHVSRDCYTGASSPSEAYANLTLDTHDAYITDLDRTRTAEQVAQRPPPRASSPAKRLHSDMDDKADVGSGTSSNPRTGKPLPAGASQRSARAPSVDMADAPGSASPEGNHGDAASAVLSTDMDDAQPSNLPSIDEQVTRVMGMMSSEPLVDGQEGYIISERWLERVWARTSENVTRPQDFSKEATQGPVGPVDNSHLVDTQLLQEELLDQHGDNFIPLSKAATLGQDFEILPRKAWDLVLSWYGHKAASPVIRRHAHNTVPGQYSMDISYELHPPIITIRKVRKTPNATENTKPAEKIVASRYESFVAFIDAAKKAVGIETVNKVRMWRILTSAPTDQPQPSQTAGILTPDASPRNGSPVAPAPGARPSLVMDIADFNSLAYGSERELVTGKDEKANEEDNESLTLADAGLTQDQTIVLEEHDEQGEYISDATKVVSKNKAGSVASKGLQSNPTSGRNTPSGGPMTRSRKQNGKVRGHVGLTNLGNTCYMNSALQCLRSVEELSMYFLNNKWKEEINVDNPIGHKGVIAKSYAGLLSAIFSLDNNSAVSPKDFKQKLGKANTLFSGYGQQDSQEFVSWLVDALHEDLNRIHKKPYCENPDSTDDTFRDPEAIRKLGEVYRNNHRARNDSVAMDLFSGFYKNTMVCPDCEKVSITFDPYSQLTLQLPIEQTWSHTITYVPLYGKPYQLEVDIDKNATIKALKEYVGKRGGGVPANRIMASEVYSHKFYRHLDDSATVSESNIGARDEIYFYELDMAPSNWPAPKKKGSKYKTILSQSSDEDIPETVSPLHDRILVPLFHRGNSTSAHRSSGHAMALWPSFIVLTRDEAKDYDAILRKVLVKVSQMTTRKILSELSSLDQSRPGSDVVLTTEEDASPNDPQVKDGSVEGEKDMVEVTMTDTNETTPPQTDESNQMPEILRPGSYIHPEFRHLFEMKHTRRGTEIVTTGWSTIDAARALEPIHKRVRIPPSREESVQSSTNGSSTTSSDEDEDTSQSTVVDANAAIDAANVSSDEEMQSIEPNAPEFARSGRQNKKKSKKARKHERKMERKHKNNKNFKHRKGGKVVDEPNYPEEPENDSDESLIRMGEALVLDWNAESMDALFGASSDDDARGMDIMKLTEVLDDPEIQEKKANRAARRKNGINLDACFVESSKSEVLSEDNAWYCSRCKELRRATKTLEIWTVPDILIIHLKRFSGHRTFRDKIEELVDFPVEGLDLSGKVGFPEGKDLTYDLFAVDNHYGGLGGGHYTAYAQNFFDKQWYEYNDSIVSRCDSRKPVSRAAYLLFYRRRSPVPLGPPSLQQIVTTDMSNPGSDDDNTDADDQQPRSRSPAGNGSRLDGSSRNGSSSAGAIGAGVGALRGGGYQRSAAENLPKNGAGAASLSDDELPPYEDVDEGFAEESYGTTPWESGDQPLWSFNSLNDSNARNTADSDDDGIASDTGAQGSVGDSMELRDRLMEDFGDDEGPGKGPWSGGMGTPVTQQEDDVAEIRLVED
ncbi:Ubiquitin carboxyl-terminal hydrolase [Pyrenophora teres f. maculata]|nr:Ubiquitin carboxyl-terminal hydrolase [Pyrenophora teres f. maculata]